VLAAIQFEQILYFFFPTKTHTHTHTHPLSLFSFLLVSFPLSLQLQLERSSSSPVATGICSRVQSKFTSSRDIACVLYFAWSTSFQWLCFWMK
jgi:hypothetical protein